MKCSQILFIGLVFLPWTATADCISDNESLVDFDGFASAMAGNPPGYLFYYPGYWDYDMGGPGDPLLQDCNANGIFDPYDFALLARAMCDDSAIAAHYQAALAYQQSIWVVSSVDYSYGAINGIAAIDTMGADGAALIAWTSGSGYGPYTTGGKAANEPLSADGDLDGDGYTNFEEYEIVFNAGGSPAQYASLATDPSAPASGPVLIIPPGAPAADPFMQAALLILLLTAGAFVAHKKANEVA